MACATQVAFRRGTTVENAAFTGVSGEITYDTTSFRLITHDGVTVGGHILALFSDIATQSRLSLSATAPLTYNNGTGVFGIALADATHDGYLSLGDWNAFNAKVNRAGDTMTGLLQFSGTLHAGIRLNNLTTAQRNAIANAAGYIIWNTTQSRLNVNDGTAWTDGFVRLAGDTMTGALNMGGNLISNLANPVGPQDAATKTYVDALSSPSMKVFNYITFR